jgi:hypothetical protein
MRARLHRFWHTRPATFPIRSGMARLRRAVTRKPRPLQILLISDGFSYTNEQQFAPLIRHAVLLRDRLGVVFQIRRVEDALGLADLARFDVVGLKLSFRVPADRAVDIATTIKKRISAGGTKFIYFDGDDDLNVQWPDLLSLVDGYVKKHGFAEVAGYGAKYIGKSNLTDYVAKTYNVSFAEDIIPKSGGADTVAAAEKIYVGWNIALDDPIVDLWKRAATMPTIEIDIDALCRAPVPPTSWLFPLRNLAVTTLEGMSGRFRILAPRERVSPEEYWREMMRSRICVSPYGYGEICWRDFEAIIAGALLVKPDMSHVKTAPDVFIPGVTYVPVRWDYADLEEKCAHYLANEDERRRIAERARAALAESMKPQWFLDRFTEVLTRAGVTLQKF